MFSKTKKARAAAVLAFLAVSSSASSSRDLLKLRYYEMATKFEKNLPSVLQEQLFLLSSVKASGRFYQIFVAFLAASSSRDVLTGN